MNDWAILFLVYAVVFISSPLIAIIHELGHAFAYLVFTKPENIDIYIGTYGNSKNNIKFKAGKLQFHLKKSFPFVKGIGLCRSYKQEPDYLKYIIILLAGPVFTFFAAGFFALLIFLTDANLYFQIVAYVFLVFSAFSLIVNLIPRDINSSINRLLNKDVFLESDGKQILFNLKIKKARAFFVEAIEHLDNKQYNQVIENLNKVLEAYPGSQKILRLIINISIESRQLGNVSGYFSQLEEKHELSNNDLLQKGIIFSLTKNHKEAINTYSKVLIGNKNNIIALNNIGYELVVEGAYEVAKRALERAIKLNPDFEHPYTNLGYSKIIQGELEEGKQLVNRSLQINNKNADAYKTLGFYYLKSNNSSMARQNFDKALELDPEIDLKEFEDELALISQLSPVT